MVCCCKHTMSFGDSRLQKSKSFYGSSTYVLRMYLKKKHFTAMVTLLSW